MAHGKTTANPNDFILPDLGEGVHEAELLKWRVQVGQTVAEHDILAEMETDKAAVEVPSPRAGVIAALHGKEGEILKVGNPLVTYADDASAAAPAPAGRADNGEAPKGRGAEAEEREDAGTVVGNVSGSLAAVSAAPGKVLATPAVRRLARDLGVDINTVVGSGIGGRVLDKDVRAAAAGGGAGGQRAAQRAGRAGVPGVDHDTVPMGPAAPHAEMAVADEELLARVAARPSAAPAHAAAAQAVPAPEARRAPAFPPGQETQRIPFRGVRRTIANRLRESVDRAVHFNVMDEADVSALDALRRKLAAASGEKISFLPFVASAVCRVLTDGRFRAINATVEEKPGDPDDEPAILRHRAVHLGIATDTEAGLMVPVIRDCDALGVLEIGRHIAHTAESARNRSIPRERLMGSTFTISNVGSHAGRFATPIINYPEVGILAVGRARPAPVIRHGGIFAGNLLPLSLACDHRVVDGATAALALAEIVRLLQEPEALLTPARG